jgi:thymidylate synthase (FAD)
LPNVSIVGVTQPRIPGINSAEELVAYAARVSNPANQMNSETAPKLLKYLVTNQHWSPLEMVSVTLEINTTRDIARQILRHRSFSFQEFSQRYAKATDLGFMFREARMQDAKNRQASNEAEDQGLVKEWQSRQKFVLEEVQEAYQWALDNGIAKEQARAVLPEGITKSRLYMAGTLRSWLHYCLLRTEMGTQKEHREIAQEAFDLLVVEFPSISDIVINNG